MSKVEIPKSGKGAFFASRLRFLWSCSHVVLCPGCVHGSVCVSIQFCLLVFSCSKGKSTLTFPKSHNVYWDSWTFQTKSQTGISTLILGGSCILAYNSGFVGSTLHIMSNGHRVSQRSSKLQICVCGQRAAVEHVFLRWAYVVHYI